MAKVQKLRNNEYYDMQTAMDNLYEENVECDFETYYCRSECCGRCDWRTDNDVLVRQDLINKK